MIPQHKNFLMNVKDGDRRSLDFVVCPYQIGYLIGIKLLKDKYSFKLMNILSYHVTRSKPTCLSPTGRYVAIFVRK